MALTLLTDAYDSVANVDAYWADRGNAAWAALTEVVKEQNIRKATDYIDRNFRFIGNRATASQRLEWPRLDAVDPDGFTVGETDAPWQVKEAMAIVADLYRAGTYDLEGIVTNDAAIRKTKVDVIEVEYDTAYRRQGEDVVTHVYKLLASLTGSGALLRS